MSNEHRTKISNSKILNRMIAAAEGEIEISAVQAQVGLGLLKKVMPDVSTVTLQGDEEGGPIITRVELVAPDVDSSGKASS